MREVGGCLRLLGGSCGASTVLGGREDLEGCCCCWGGRALPAAGGSTAAGLLPHQADEGAIIAHLLHMGVAMPPMPPHFTPAAEIVFTLSPHHHPCCRKHHGVGAAPHRLALQRATGGGVARGRAGGSTEKPSQGLGLAASARWQHAWAFPDEQETDP